MITVVRRLWCDEGGTAIIEYALAASLMSLAMLAGVQILTVSLSATVNNLSRTLNLNEVLGY